MDKIKKINMYVEEDPKRSAGVRKFIRQSFCDEQFRARANSKPATVEDKATEV